MMGASSYVAEKAGAQVILLTKPKASYYVAEKAGGLLEPKGASAFRRLPLGMP